MFSFFFNLAETEQAGDFAPALIRERTKKKEEALEVPSSLLDEETRQREMSKAALHSVPARDHRPCDHGNVTV